MINTQNEPIVVVTVPPAFLKVPELRGVLGVSRAEVYRFMKAHGIAPEEIYPGGPKRVRYSAILAATAPKSEGGAS